MLEKMEVLTGAYLKIGMFLSVLQLPNIKRIPDERSLANARVETKGQISSKMCSAQRQEKRI